MSVKILEVKALTKHFDVSNGLFRKKGKVRAVECVSFDVHHLETLGIVGESGSGKSTLGRVILRLLSPTGGCVIYRPAN